MRETSRPSGQSGFSLIELIVAMAVTMVVTGAVYGLMAGGNNAFRREPELTDRQQNARIAMDMIQRDIATAGVNMGVFFQSFSRFLDAKSAVKGPSGQNADHLEIFGNDGTCPDAPAMPPTGTSIPPIKPDPGPYSGSNINGRGAVPSCYSEDSIVLVTFSNGGAKWGLAHEIHSKDGTDINFPPGPNIQNGSQITNPDDLKSFQPGDGSYPTGISALNVIRYEVALDTDGTPSLFRSGTGGRDPSTGQYSPPPSAAGKWQLLARGVEDMQVEYRNGLLPLNDPAAWMDEPGNVLCSSPCVAPTATDYNRGIREVRVTLSVRASGQNLAGQTTSQASGRPNAVRGSVTTVTSVKALQSYLAQVTPTAACPECPVWR